MRTVCYRPTTWRCFWFNTFIFDGAGVWFDISAEAQIGELETSPNEKDIIWLDISMPSVRVSNTEREKSRALPTPGRCDESLFSEIS